MTAAVPVFAGVGAGCALALRSSGERLGPAVGPLLTDLLLGSGALVLLARRRPGR